MIKLIQKIKGNKTLMKTINLFELLILPALFIIIMYDVIGVTGGIIAIVIISSYRLWRARKMLKNLFLLYKANQEIKRLMGDNIEEEWEEIVLSSNEER